MKNGSERICQGTAKADCSLKDSEPESQDGSKAGRNSNLIDKEPVPLYLSEASRADLVNSAKFS